MAGVADYLRLQDEYKRIVDVLKRDLRSGSLETAEALQSTVLELYGFEAALRVAVAAPEQSSEQSLRLAMRHADTMDRILHDLLHKENRLREWEEHRSNVQSIIGRWPGVKPGR